MERKSKTDLFTMIQDRLSTASNIAVLCHAYSDGDAIGSALAIYSAIKRVYSQTLQSVTCIMEEPVPAKYDFLPGAENMLQWPEGKGRYDLVVTVDTASAELLGHRAELLEGAFVISLDHHSSHTPYSDIDVREADYGACGELVYEFICHIAGKPTADEALCLYTAIASDTGGLSQKNATPNSMMVSAMLAQYESVKVDEVAFRLFKASTYARNKVMGYCLSNEERYADGKICFSYITGEIMQETGCTDADTEGIVNALFATEGCEIAILARETTDGIIKCSLRSHHANVADVAAHFGGGGHINAAGCRLDTDPKTAAETLAQYIMQNGLI